MFSANSTTAASGSLLQVLEEKAENLNIAVHQVCMHEFEHLKTLKLNYAFDKDIQLKRIGLEKLGKLVELISKDMRVVIQDVDDIEPSIDKFISATIIVIDSFGSFEKLEIKLNFDNVKFRKYHLIVLVGNFKRREIEHIFKSFWKQWIIDVSVVVMSENGTIQMLTFFPFARGCDYDFSPNIINEFELNSLKWKSLDFYPTKLTNLKSCNITAGYLSEYSPAIIIEKDKTGRKTFSGFEVDIISEISQRINANLQFQHYNSSRREFFINETIIIEGFLLSIAKGQSDFGMGCFSFQQGRAKILSETRSFISASVVMVVPPGKKMYAFKKLVKPFSTGSWFLLGAFSLVACIFVIILECTSVRAYKLFISDQVRNPIMSMIIGILGLSLHKLPIKSFPRFLLMKFLILCLVIRSIYQGKMFILLQTDLKEHQVESIVDVVQKNMSFYAFDSMYLRMEDFKYRNMVKEIKHGELEKYMKKTLDDNFDGVVFNYRHQVEYSNILHQQEYLYTVAREVFLKNQIVFYCQRNHFLVNIFSKYIDLFQQSGLIIKWMSKYTKRQLHHFHTEKSPQTLTLAHLSAVFYVLLIGISISFLFFAIENFYFQVSNRLKVPTLLEFIK